MGAGNELTDSAKNALGSGREKDRPERKKDEKTTSYQSWSGARTHRSSMINVLKPFLPKNDSRRKP